jgi:hypothetical protein
VAQRAGLRPLADANQDRPAGAGNFDAYFAGNKLPLLWFGEPSEMDSRLVAQSGLFVLPGVLDKPLDAILDGYGGSEGPAHAIRAAGQHPREAMRALYRMNVTYATLFPDLDGLARSVSYELEAIWERLVEDYERSHNEDPTLAGGDRPVGWAGAKRTPALGSPAASPAYSCSIR